MSEDTLRRGLASGVAATGFAAFEGAKPGRSTDSRGVVGDAGARWGDASGVVAGARTVSGSGTAGNLPGDLLRARAGASGGVAGRNYEVRVWGLHEPTAEVLMTCDAFPTRILSVR